jgi:hypothetical protein
MGCPKFTLQQAKRLMKKVRLPKGVSLNWFHHGLNVEREHRDVTKCNPLWTAKIAAVHFNEGKLYYYLLDRYVEKGRVWRKLGKVG